MINAESCLRIQLKFTNTTMVSFLLFTLTWCHIAKLEIVSKGEFPIQHSVLYTGTVFGVNASGKSRGKTKFSPGQGIPGEFCKMSGNFGHLTGVGEMSGNAEPTDMWQTWSYNEFDYNST